MTGRSGLQARKLAEALRERGCDVGVSDVADALDALDLALVDAAPGWDLSEVLARLDMLNARVGDIYDALRSR